nr:MAG TPA: hypothetical protein [Caudoviricetes sp.]
MPSLGTIKVTIFRRDTGALKCLYARVASNLMQSIKMTMLQFYTSIRETETVEI